MKPEGVTEGREGGDGGGGSGNGDDLSGERRDDGEYESVMMHICYAKDGEQVLFQREIK